MSNDHAVSLYKYTKKAPILLFEVIFIDQSTNQSPHRRHRSYKSCSFIEIEAVITVWLLLSLLLCHIVWS